MRSVTIGVANGPAGVSPVPKSTFLTFRSPYAGGFFGTATFQVLTVPSMAFAHICQARLPLAPLGGIHFRRGRIHFMLRTVRLR